MANKSNNFLFDYLKTSSPTGFETAGQRMWLDYIRPYVDDYMTDSYGSVVGVINPQAIYKVVIEAHADEIAWLVNYITSDGYIYVVRNGGSDPYIAPSKRVNIFTEKGIVEGHFGFPAIHVRQDSKKDFTPTVKNLFIDIGCETKEEVEAMGVKVGCVAVFQDEPYILNNRYYVGRALDNRIGGFVIAEVARKLHKNKIKLPFGLYVVNAVQEEIGLRGAEMIARKIKPDVAIITDVCHDSYSPAYSKIDSGDVKAGRGPVLATGPAVQNNLLKMLYKTAEDAKIPYQRQAASRSTGTDTESFAYSNEGVPSALISMPLKYMHTTVETVSIIDVKNCIKLMYKFLTELEAGHDFRYIK